MTAVALFILALALAFTLGCAATAALFLGAAVNRENAKPATPATADDVRR